MSTKKKITARDFLRVIEWSEEDRCFIGSAPPLIGRCCHGATETQVVRELTRIVEGWVAIHGADKRPLPAPIGSRELSHPMPLGACASRKPRMRRWTVLTAGCLLARTVARATPLITGAGENGNPHVIRFEGGVQTASFLAYQLGVTAGVRVAAGDVNGDGSADIITGLGPGVPAHVRVFSGAELGEIRSFFAYDPAFRGGVFVASGDVDGDGRAEIITGPGPGAGQPVRVFSGQTGNEILSFFAYGGSTGGVRVAAGDVNGDGRAEIVTGAGFSSGGHVKVFDGASGAEIRSFFAYSGFNGGVFVAAGDVNGDGRADIVTGSDAGAHVKVFDGVAGGALAAPRVALPQAA